VQVALGSLLGPDLAVSEAEVQFRVLELYPQPHRKRPNEVYGRPVDFIRDQILHWGCAVVIGFSAITSRRSPSFEIGSFPRPDAVRLAVDIPSAELDLLVEVVDMQLLVGELDQRVASARADPVLAVRYNRLDQVNRFIPRIEEVGLSGNADLGRSAMIASANSIFVSPSSPFSYSLKAIG